LKATPQKRCPHQQEGKYGEKEKGNPEGRTLKEAVSQRWQTQVNTLRKARGRTDAAVSRG